MSYRYYSLTDINGFHRCNLLLHDRVILDFRKRLHGLDFEQFYSINRYSADGELLSSPIYVDVDSGNLYDAYEKAMQIVHDLKHLLDMPIHVWFSGSKGFHIIAPFEVVGRRSFEVVKWIISDITKDYDGQVYRTRSMWRLPSTINKKSGNYKVYLGDLSGLSFEKIIEMSKLNKSLPMPFNRFYKSDYLDSLISEIVLPEYSEKGMADYTPLPCVLKLLEQHDIDKGIRNKVGYVVCRHFFLMGKSLMETVELVKALPMYNNRAAREFNKITRSVYRYNAQGVSCRNGDDFLQNYCSSKFCPYNDKISVTDFFRRD